MTTETSERPDIMDDWTRTFDAFASGQEPAQLEQLELVKAAVRKGWAILSREGLFAVASLFGERERLTTALARSNELLAGARHQCGERTKELLAAEVQIRHLQREAVVGHFVLELERQLLRLRRMAAERPDDFSIGISPAETAAVVSGELAEVGLEPPGSPAAQRESGDVWVGGLHLLLAHGGVPIVELEAAHARIKLRLDIMEEHNCSWPAAKRIISELAGG